MSTTANTSTTSSSIDRRIDSMRRVPLGAGGFIGLLICYVMANYDIGVFALVVPSMLAEFKIDPGALALPVFFNLLGYAVGAYLFGYIADRWGRQRGILVTVVVLAVGSALAAVSWDIASFTVFRFIAGLGMGAILTVCAAYINEVAPVNRRGQYLAIIYTVQGVILTVTGILSPWFMGVLPSAGWRLLLGFGVLAIVALAFLNRRGIIESPRWLVQAGRTEAAERNLGVLESRVGGRVVIPETGDGSPIEPLTASINAENRIKPWAVLVRPPYVGRLALVLVFWFLFYIMAYGFLSYTTVLLEALGISEGDSLTITAWGRILTIAVPFLFIWIIDRVERRTLVIIGAAICAVGVLLLLVPLGSLSGYAGVILTNLGISWLVTPGYVYTAELFPTRARSSATSFADGVGHMGGAISGYIVLPILAAGGGVAAAWVLIAAVAIGGFLIAFGPKTKGKALEEIAQD